MKANLGNSNQDMPNPENTMAESAVEVPVIKAKKPINPIAAGGIGAGIGAAIIGGTWFITSLLMQSKQAAETASDLFRSFKR